MQFYGQRDARWAGEELGWGPPGATIGAVGCLETDFAMVARNSFSDLAYITPDTMNKAFIAAHVYLRDENLVDYDLLPDNALDHVWPNRFKTSVVPGFDAAGIRAAVPTLDTYTLVWVTPPGISHFVMIASPDGATIIDPWTDAYGKLSGYGGPGAVRKTIYVRALSPTPPPPPPPPPGDPIFPVPTGVIDWDSLEDNTHRLHGG